MKKKLKYYTKLVNQYSQSEQYVKASLVYRNKIKDTERAQSMLLNGWRTNRDSFNCLNNYFNNISDLNDLKTEIQNIYQNETNDDNKETFLKALKFEYNKSEELQDTTRKIAYEIIAEIIEYNKQISSELVHFNHENKTILKDIFKYKSNHKKIIKKSFIF